MEKLGTQMIQGVNAEGTRITTTFPAGMYGNDRPFSMVAEHWVSTDLKITVLTKTSDPRFGENITRMENLNRTEPDPALFQIPADYEIVEGDWSVHNQNLESVAQACGFKFFSNKSRIRLYSSAQLVGSTKP